MDMDEMEISYDSEDEQYDSRDKQKFNFLAKKTSKSKRKFNIDPFVLIEHLLSDHEDDDQEVEDDDVASIEDDDLEQNVNFDAPESGYGDDDSDTPNINIDQGFAWIVYWILKYQERYRLSDVATNSLIKFIRYLLISHDKNTYSTFPTSLYMARKLFGIGDQIIKYATCPTCCKLYSVNKLPTDKPSHCSFQNFPNHPMANYRSPCGAVITKQVPTNQGIIYRPALIFLSLILNTNYNNYTIRKDLRNRVGNGQLGLITIMNCQIYMTEEFGKNLKIQMKTDCSSGMTYRIVTWGLC